MTLDVVPTLMTEHEQIVEALFDAVDSNNIKIDPNTSERLRALKALYIFSDKPWNRSVFDSLMEEYEAGEVVVDSYGEMRYNGLHAEGARRVLMLVLEAYNELM